MQTRNAAQRRDPLYKKIYTKLRATIAAGTVPVGSLLPSEVQLCERHKASRITVKHALDLLREDGLVRVIHGAGWQVIAPEKSAPHASTLGTCLIAVPQRLEAMVVARAAEERLRTFGIAVRHFSLPRLHDAGWDEAIAGALAGPETPRGLLLFSDRPVPEALAARLNEQNIRVVCAGLQELGAHSAAAMDNAAAMETLTRFIAARGHRNILYVSGEKLVARVPGFRARLQGYRAAMDALNLTPEILLLDPNSLHFPECERALLDLLQRLDAQGRRVTAVLASTGMQAQGVAMLLARQGRRVPQDCALACIGAGHDPDALESIGLHGLTCIEEPWEEIGIAAADALADGLLRPGASPRLTLAPGRLADHGTVPALA